MSKLQKVFAGVVGLAMVLTLVSAVAPARASAMMSGSYSANLTVGSRGEDVSALQQTLINGGYLTAVSTPTGYFGAATKAAVSKWQAAVGISPASGFVGPISRAYLNSHMTGGTPGCPAGATFNSMTGAPCGSAPTPGCPAGAMFNSMTGAPCTTVPAPTGGTWTPDGTDGSVTVSYVSYAPASQTLKKGDTNKPLISVKLQAVNGKVAVTRFDVYFSERPWLDFGSVSLTDSTGKILATKTLTSASDVTEVTVGSNYLVRFDVATPIVVTPGSDMILAVAGNVLAASDKITGQTVYVGIPSGSIRTINGKGYTDSFGLSSGQGSAATAASGNSIVLSTTGSTGTVFTRISPSTPPQRIVVTSNTQQTTNVVLGVFGLKVQNQNATLNSLAVNINTGTATASYATTSLISNLRLQVGGQTYGANSLAAGNTTFTNMSVPMTADVWTDATLIADIASGYNSNNITASSTLVAASIGGVDSNYNTLTLTSASNVTSNSITFLQAGLSLTNPVATLGSAISGVVPGNIAGTVGYNTHYSFTLTNTGNTDVYVSRSAGSFLGTTTVLAGVAAANTASSSITNLTVSDTQPGDSASSLAYVVAAGNSRSFTFDGVLKAGAGGGISSQTITAVYFNSTAASVGATSTASAITFGLNSLTLNAGF